MTMLTREEIYFECSKVIDALPDRGETIDGADDALLKLNKQACIAVDLQELVDAYRLAGKWAELGTNCHDCPVRLGTCGNNKKPACQHPSEYEAEWISAYKQAQAGKESV